MKRKRRTKPAVARLGGRGLWAAWLLLPLLAGAQTWQGKFEQLGPLLPTPNTYRTASGAPGPAYWQQQADYRIRVKLDENTRLLSGREEVTLYNRSPHALRYLWFQLDQNIRQPGSPAWQTQATIMPEEPETLDMLALSGDYRYEGGMTIGSVADSLGRPLPYTINYTQMRVELPAPLGPGEKVTVQISWHYTVYDRLTIDGRGGCEYFPDDGNYLFTIAQWYPRLSAFDDVEGWQNKQFLGQGEFALSFGDFDVEITVPADHLVAATGELINAGEVLTPLQLSRLEKARQATSPVIIVSEKEVRQKEKSRATGTSTWHFKASRVRDFAFASSRKFIWDAMAVPLGTNRPLAMSFYPKEGNPLWEKHSTLAVAHALQTYSRHTFDYPYPVAISVHTANQGMEYPMICFNGGRPDKRGRYSLWTLQDMVAVIVHEVGHNYFPMIINSDERQWTWMDEGLNTFLEHLTLAEHYPYFELSWGTPAGITHYMRGNPDYIRPIMTNSEQVVQFGYNAYGKPSAALLVLREVVMGRELFDYAFREYARRWAFKRPMPADFFRTMEDASAVDLDWFWRGWFFTTWYVDIELAGIRWYRVLTPGDSLPPVRAGSAAGGLGAPLPLYLTPSGQNSYREFRNRLDDPALISRYAGKNLYELHLISRGELPSPVIIEWHYADGSSEAEVLPAEIWRMNEREVKKVFLKEKQVVRVVLDPEEKTADVNTGNNVFPPPQSPSRFELFRKKK